MHLPRPSTALFLALVVASGCGNDAANNGSDASTGNDTSSGGDASTGNETSSGGDASTMTSNGGAPTTDTSPIAGAPGHLLVATSHVPRLIDLSDGSTTEIFRDLLRWPQNPGHLYQHWDVSPDGAFIVIYDVSADDRLVVYPINDSAAGKVLVKSGGMLGNFTFAPCFASADTILVLPATGGVWKIDPNLDETQTPVKVEDIPDRDDLNGPMYWNRDCTGFIAQGYRSNGTNDGSDNLGYYALGSDTLTQLSQHYGNTRGMTLAQDTNFPGCTGTGCVIAKNGGTTEKMGFLPSGVVWFDSNRDMWRDADNDFHGAVSVLQIDPTSGQAFADLQTLEEPRVRAVSRDGNFYAVINGDSIEVLDASDTRVVLSSDDFNAANVPGFMRFVQ